MKTDFLIIGSGIAGLTYALKVAQLCPDRSVTLLTKSSQEETNTKYAQGGIAGVMDVNEDSFAQHISDTMVAGDGLCDPDVVELVVREGVERIQEIISRGARFDRHADGTYSLGREGGHSVNRILHHKDMTGNEMERTLLEAVQQYPNLQIISHCFVLDLITQHHLGYLVTKSTPDVTCYGVYVLDRQSGRIEKILSRITLLATGGIGQVYRTTTNPSIATGDGVAMVYRAKGRIMDMEFIQFHPTALYQPGSREHSFLITEAVRGEGAVLRNAEGEAFMEKYDARKDLAPRDVVARAIDQEMKISGAEFVYLDATGIPTERFQSHFLNIGNTCIRLGIDPSRDFIPVAPAAHYSCGGIHTDTQARTSIRHLYAAGECACTGLHGANRLASNSLLEAMVFAHRAASSSVEEIHASEWREDVPDWNTSGTLAPREKILITQSVKELKWLMTDYVGIFRNDERLARASRRLDLLHAETEDLYERTQVSPQLCELRNMITVAYLVVKSAEFRKESRGLHFNTDHPHRSTLVQHTLL